MSLFAQIITEPELRPATTTEAPNYSFFAETASGTVYSVEWMPGAGIDSCPCIGDVVLADWVGSKLITQASFTHHAPQAKPGERVVTARRYLPVTDSDGDKYTFPFISSQVSMQTDGTINVQNYRYTSDDPPVQKKLAEFALAADGALSYTNYDEDEAVVNTVIFAADGKITQTGTEININSGDGNTAITANEIHLNGDKKSLVTYDDLKKALSEFWTKTSTALKAATYVNAAGDPTVLAWVAQLPSSIDISASEAKTIKTS
jgi:hypothetical protein